MQKSVLFFFLILVFSATAFPQQNGVLVIENGVEKEILLDESSRDSKTEQLSFFYFNQGFFDAEVESKEELFIIKTGNRYTISFLRFYEMDSLLISDKVIESQNYSQELIEGRIRQFYEQLVNEGYRNAEVFVRSLIKKKEDATVSIEVDVIKKERMVISGIVFNGNQVNSQKYLAKISRMPDSVHATQKNLLEIQRNLISSELFETVSEPQIFNESGRQVLLFSVRERNLNQFDGLIGYVPDSRGNGQVVGDINVTLWNVLQDGNGFNLAYQRLRPETSRLELGVWQHWFGNIPVGAGLDFTFYQNDTTYQTRRFGFNSSYWVTPGLRLKGGIYSLNSNSSRFSQQEPDGIKQGANLGFSFSNLNRFNVPTSGVKLDVLYGIGDKDIENDSAASFRQQQLEAGLETYVPLAAKSVLAIHMKGFYLIGEAFTESDLIRFGGANSFRGYAEEQFTASELFWGDIEYRFLTDKLSYLFLFGAAGYYNRPNLASETDHRFSNSGFLYSGGLGISYKTTIGRLTFTYALSAAETIGNGKVHISLKSAL